MSFLPMMSGIPMWGQMGAQMGARAPITGPSMPPIPGANPGMGVGGLLENPLFGAGLGLLSANTPSPNPVNYAGGLMGGLAMSQNAAMNRQNTDMQRARYAAEMERLAQQQQEWAAKQAQTKAQEEATARLKTILGDPQATPEQKTSALIDAGYGDSVVKQAMEPPPAMWAPPKTMNVGGKEVMVQVDPVTGQYKAIGSGGVEINMGDAQKPVGTDAAKYIYEDGSTPLPNETITDIVAKGGRLVTPGEDAERKRKGSIEADKAELDAKMAEAQRSYDAAVEAFKANPTNPKAIRDLDNAAAALKTAMGGKENWRGEPSGDVVRRFTVPGPLGVTVEKGIEAIFGNGGAQIARPTTQADYDALPRGASYVDPDDGKTYRKP